MICAIFFGNNVLNSLKYIICFKKKKNYAKSCFPPELHLFKVQIEKKIIIAIISSKITNSLLPPDKYFLSKHIKYVNFIERYCHVKSPCGKQFDLYMRNFKNVRHFEVKYLKILFW